MEGETDRQFGERGEEWLDKHLADRFEILPSRTRDFDRIYVMYEPLHRPPSADDRVMHDMHGSGTIERVAADGDMIVVKFRTEARGPETRRSLPFPSDDYIVEARNEVKVEIKTEKKSYKSRNAFIETVSKDRPRKVKGWACTSKADYLFHFVPQSGRIRVVPFEKLREHLPDWLSRHGETKNHGTWDRHGTLLYYSFGALVPFVELERITSEILDIPPMPLEPPATRP